MARRRSAAGYSLAFVNEEGVTVGTGVGGNAGLSTAVTQANLFQRLSAGKPTIPTPEFKTTRTMADQIGVSLTSVIRGMDQDVKQPHVHQFSAGVTREIMWNMAVEARYVGSRGRDIWRGIDLNQMNAIGALGGAFAADFQRARQNGFLAQAAGLGFVPDFNASIPGSQVLTVLPTFGQLAVANVRTAIQQNELARLADLYISTGSQTALARSTFLPNSGIYASEYVSNTSFQDYDALQLELRRQFRHGDLRPDQLHVQRHAVRLDRRYQPEPHRAVPRQQPAAAGRRTLALPQRARHQRERGLRAAVRSKANRG